MSAAPPANSIRTDSRGYRRVRPGLGAGRAPVGPRPGHCRAAAVAALCSALSLPLAPGLAPAGVPAVSVSGGDSLTVWVLVEWEEPLPGFVRTRLERGIPSTVGVRAELWRDRTGWFDANLAVSEFERKLVPDPWSSGYSVLAPEDPAAPIVGPLPERSATHVPTVDDLEDLLSRHRLRIDLDPAWCDDASTYQILVVTSVRPLTADDVGEVEGWLRGGIDELPGGLLGLPRGLFGFVRDLAGLGERSYKGTSPRFRVATTPGGRVRVLIPGGGEVPRGGRLSGGL